MVMASGEVKGLVCEHHALMAEYGRAQIRCSQMLMSQADQIMRLEAQLMWLEDQLMRARVAIVLRDTAREWDSARRARQQSGYPPKRGKGDGAKHGREQAAQQEADLVICQTGCVSHGNYWREHEYCSRTARQCVLVDNPHALDGFRGPEGPRAGRSGGTVAAGAAQAGEGDYQAAD